MNQKGLLMFSSSQKAQQGLTTHCQETRQHTHTHARTHKTGRAMSKYFPLRRSRSFIKKFYQTVWHASHISKILPVHALSSLMGGDPIYVCLSIKTEYRQLMSSHFFIN